MDHFRTFALQHIAGWAAFMCCYIVLAAPATGQQNDQRTLAAELQVVRKYEQQSRVRWEAAIQQLEALDEHEKHPDDSILFIGSSSIRLWKTIAADMAPYHPIRRGYGGAKFSDLAVFAERLISRQTFRAVVIFVANDVSGKPDDHSTDEVELLVRNVLRTIRGKAPTAPVFLVEITPTIARFDAWQKIRASNRVLREICLTTPNTYFIATAEHYLNCQKKPIEQLFIYDKLHLNLAGYKLWSTLIKLRLKNVMSEKETDGT